MKFSVVMAMIIVGGLLIFVPIAAHEYSKERTRDSIVDFYKCNGNAAVLPPDMQTNYGPYDYVCLIMGIGTLGVGVVSAGVDYLGITAAIRGKVEQI